MNTPNNNFFDIINLASLILGIQNLSENRQQSAHNDIQNANQNQAEFLLREINRQFEEQNKLLRQIWDKLNTPPTDWQNKDLALRWGLFYANGRFAATLQVTVK